MTQSNGHSRTKLLVLDVDGTILDRESQLRPRVRAAIRDAVAAGHHVTLATGRRFRSASQLAAELELRLPLILSNGALIKDSATEEIIYSNHLSVAAARTVATIMIDLGIQPVVFENAAVGDSIVTGPAEYDSDEAARYLRNPTAIVRRVDHAELFDGRDPLRLAAFGGPPTIQRLEGALESVPDCRTVVNVTGTMVRVGGRLLEVLSPTCSKGEAMLHLAQRYNLGLADTIAIGDYYNDLEMLEVAGIGIVMANAPDDLKARVRHVTTSNEEDGVALAIERFLLAPAGPTSEI
ncbi:MAG: HAD family hydrolase [Chloroflexi bacterium]|nr:HAD family hydrolase [Chloroflexota bacterium]